MAAIELSGVGYQRNGRRVLHAIDLSIGSGRLVAIVGPSGAGKSTLLRIIAGLDRPSSGTVTVDGRAVAGTPPPRLAMVAETDGLYEHLDVGANVEFPSRLQRASKTRIDLIARDAGRRMRVARLWRRSPSTLSGGERNLVAVARAIARDELDVLLLDEPLSKADRQVRDRFRGDLRRLHATGRITTVLATNDQSEALALADVLVVLLEGSVAQIGAPLDVFDSPISTAVASFVGPLPMNLMPAQVVREGGERWLAVGSDRVKLGPQFDLEEGTRVIIGFHAHELIRADAGTEFGRTLRVTVSQVHDLGSTTQIRFGLGQSPAGVFVMTENRPAAVRPGDRLELTWVPGRMRLFAADSGQAIPM